MGKVRIAQTLARARLHLGGRAREVLFSRQLVFYSPQHTLFEVEKYLPNVALRIGQSELTLFREFQLLPVTALQPQQYDFTTRIWDRWGEDN